MDGIHTRRLGSERVSDNNTTKSKRNTQKKKKTTKQIHIHIQCSNNVYESNITRRDDLCKKGTNR